MKYTQQQIILNYLRETGDWVSQYSLIKLNTKWGYLGPSARTRSQELAQEGKVEHRFGSKTDPMLPGKFSWYKAKPIQFQRYKVMLPDGSIDREIIVGPAQNKLF
jgi:hypothetical protein